MVVEREREQDERRDVCDHADERDHDGADDDASREAATPVFNLDGARTFEIELLEELLDSCGAPWSVVVVTIG